MDTLTDVPITVLIPTLLVDKQNIDRHLAIEQDAKFDLDKLVNETLMSQDSYKSVAHYLLDTLSSDADADLSLKFNQSQPVTWLDIIVMISVALSLILAIISIRRVHLLTTILAAQRLPAALGTHTRRPIPDIFRYGTTTTITTPHTDLTQTHTSLLQGNRDYLPFEITAIIFTMLMFGFLLYIFCKFRSPRTQTTLRIIVTNTSTFSDYVILNWFPLPHAFFTYDLSTNASNNTIIPHFQFPFIRIKLDINFLGLSITHRQTQTAIQFPTQMCVSLITALKLRRLMAGSCYIVVMVLNKDNEEIISTDLTHFYEAGHAPESIEMTEMHLMPRETPRTEQPHLYPDLSAA